MRSVSRWLVAGLFGAGERGQAPNRKKSSNLRVIVFGAHPDDCELEAGGTAALWAAQGARGEIRERDQWRHWSSRNGRRRVGQAAGRAEVQECAKILGITTEVLDNHDGELLPTLENRRTITRLIREWKADLVISHRPNDYHPDHRYTARAGAGRGVHGDRAQFLPGRPRASEEPGVHVHGGRISEAAALRA